MSESFFVRWGRVIKRTPKAAPKREYTLDIEAFTEAKKIFKERCPALPVMVKEAELEYALLGFLLTAVKADALTLHS